MGSVFRSALGLWVVVIVVSAGCDRPQEGNSVSHAESEVKQAAEAVADDVEEAVEKGEQVAKDVGQKAKELGEQAMEEANQLSEQAADTAQELGEQAMAFLTPLKEKFGNLESMKDKPDELKQAVIALIQSIEEKAAEIDLPDGISKALTTVKAKLVELRDYLEGEVEQAKLDERLNEIKNSVKESFGT